MRERMGEVVVCGVMVIERLFAFLVLPRLHMVLFLTLSTPT